MRVASLNGRLSLLHDGRALDVERASRGRFSARVDAAVARWDELATWAEGANYDDAKPFEPDRLDLPAPSPRQIFAIGMNYRDHAAEAGFAKPETPAVFTKFASCLTGPFAAITLPTSGVDWEVELVAVVGRPAERVPEDQAWDYVAGLTVGQDLSERSVQLAGPAPQFSLGKSFPGFGPLGPAIVSVDEFEHPDDLELGCSIGDEQLQLGRTSDMIFTVPELLARLSAVCPLYPGDLIFTGTPAGVGGTRNPPRFLEPGTTLVSHIEGIGELRNRLAD